MKRTDLGCRPELVLLACAIVLPLGCGGGTPPAADPGKASESLRLALDAWQGGAAPDSFQQEQAIIVNDYEWRSGVRLLSYQVDKEEPLGADLRCFVQLSLRDTRG